MAVIGEVVIQFHDDGSITNAGFRQELLPPQGGTADDPWAGIDAQPAQQQPAQQWGQPQQQYMKPAQVPTPVCAHGPLKAVPGGMSGPNSKNPGRPYAAFWACQAPQGQAKCKLDQKQLPPVPA